MIIFSKIIKNLPIFVMEVEKLEQVGGMEKCKQWLDSCSSSAGDVISDGTSGNPVVNSEPAIGDDGVDCENHIGGEKSDVEPLNQTLIRQPRNHHNKIQIYKSRKVHIGNVTHINGPVYLDQNAAIANIINNRANRKTTVVVESDDLAIQRRTNWIAQSPLEAWTYLQDPAKFVIILHSATKEAFTEPENRYLVRVMQDRHILRNKLTDIAYNFLIGSDGTIFEGRGWKVEGVHSHNYDRCSVGICFIGRFEERPPPGLAIVKAKALIRRGVECGAIAEDYTLLAQCQVTTKLDPGDGEKLYEEVKTWKNWDGSVGLRNPDSS